MRYFDIYKALKQNITSGRYLPGSRLPYVTELMDRFTAGRCTVQHALKLLSREGLTRGVPSQGTYVRSPGISGPFGRSRVKQRVAVVGRNRVIPALTAPYYSDICLGIDSWFREQEVEVYPLALSGKTFQELLKEINAYEITGIIGIDLPDTGVRPDLEGLGIPMVYVDMLDAGTRLPIYTGNNQEGGRLAVKTLTDRGFRKLLYITGHGSRSRKMASGNRDKWRGIREQAGRMRGVSAVKETVGPDGDHRTILKVLLNKHPKCRGIMVTGQPLLFALKNVIESMPAAARKEYRAVVFECFKLPVYIDRRPCFVCQWDGMALGKAAAKGLFDRADPKKRIYYQPMTIDTLE